MITLYPSIIHELQNRNVFKSTFHASFMLIRWPYNFLLDDKQIPNVTRSELLSESSPR